MALFLWPVEYGALTQLYAGTMPEALDYNGEVSARPAVPALLPPLTHRGSSLSLGPAQASARRRRMMKI